jgi:micrococcal nuclease|tara:strand:- start:3656 stop:4171 length:516 start_codon:yes stop_codon:yes gene_type:complete
MNTNEYDVKVLKVVDGDTVDVDIDLGFGITLTDERVRIMGIDTPESRTSDRVEDLFGEAAKLRLKQLMKKGGKLITTEDRKGEDMKGKFGRILGDFKVEYNGEMKKVTEIMAEEGHCVPYFGGSKEETQAAHMVNRTRLLKEGLISQAKYDKAVIQMEKKAAKAAKKAAKK